MTIEDDIAFFDSVPMLHLLGRNTLRLIALGAEPRQMVRGEALFRPGEIVDCGYVVKRGSFVVSADPETGALAKTAEAGTVIGEMALITASARPRTAIALEPSTVVRISRDLFMKILEQTPDAAMRLRDHLQAHTERLVNDVQRVRVRMEKLNPPE